MSNINSDLSSIAAKKDRIVISLSAKYSPKGWRNSFVIMLIITCATVLFNGWLFFARYMPQRDTVVFIYSIIIMAFSIGCLIFTIFCFIKYKISKHKLPKILEDVVELRAYSKLEDMRQHVTAYSATEYFKLEVSFEYNNEVRIVLGKYIPGIREFANREISIFFSPKYNEVFILKD